MRWSDLFATSLASLRQRAFRTSLTVLGVLIGTTAVIVMVSLGVGMSSAFEQSIQSASLRQVRVSAPPPDARAQGISDKLNDNLANHLGMMPGVQAAWPAYSVDAEARVAGVPGMMRIEGMPRDAIEALDLDLAWGSLPSVNAPLGVVVGDQVDQMFWDERSGETTEVDFTKDTLFVAFGSNPYLEGGPAAAPPPGADNDAEAPAAPPAPPKRVIVPVIAELVEAPAGWGPSSGTVYADLDALVAAMEKAMPGKALPGQPATADGRPIKGFIYSDIRLQTESPEAAEALLLDLRDKGYQADGEVEWIRQAQQQGVMIQAVFGGIGFISLLVAAIGIANTMLMSVYERTREIGIMKVLGASLADIRKLFLIESATIGLIGGLAGLLFSLTVSFLLNATIGEAAMGGVGKLSVIPLWLMLGAVGFATLIGTAAGLAPAQRATKLSPLAAIRSQ